MKPDTQRDSNLDKKQRIERLNSRFSLITHITGVCWIKDNAKKNII